MRVRTFFCAVALTAPALSACVPLGLHSGPHSAWPAGRWVLNEYGEFALAELPEGRLWQPPGELAASPSSTIPQPLLEALTEPRIGGYAVEPPWALRDPPLSPGDRLRVTVEDGDEFSGSFEIGIDGDLKLPFLPALKAAGHGPAWLESRLREALVNGGFFHAALVRADVRVQQWSQIQVNVAGAVFQPGLVTINVRKPEEKALKSAQDSGDFPPDRLLQAALRSAGGLRPDADPMRVVLLRNQERRVVDVSPTFDGLPVPSIPLMSGDTLFVPSTGVYRETLVRPTPITPQGVRVFMSNLTVPATDNSKSNINDNSTGLPYGTRFINGLISANCVGGTAATNSSRYGVLVTLNPLTRQYEALHRSIEDLLRQPDRSDLNPYLMPNDGIACYDSGVTNLRDIGKTLVDILAPWRLGPL